MENEAEALSQDSNQTDFQVQDFSQFYANTVSYNCKTTPLLFFTVSGFTYPQISPANILKS